MYPTKQQAHDALYPPKPREVSALDNLQMALDNFMQAIGKAPGYIASFLPEQVQKSGQRLGRNVGREVYRSHVSGPAALRDAAEGRMRAVQAQQAKTKDLYNIIGMPK
jgi:hypothetical protein